MDVVPQEGYGMGIGNRESGVGNESSNTDSRFPIPDSHSVPLQPLLEFYRLRVRRERRLRYLALAGIGVGALWLATALLTYADAASPWMGLICLGATALLPGMALALERWQRPTITRTAEMLDKRLDNRQRLVTSVELLSGSEEQPLAEMAHAQLSSSTELLSSIDAEELYPTRTPWPAFSLGGGLLLVALGLFLLKGALDGFIPLQVGSLPPDQKDLAALVSPTAQSGLPESERTPPAGANSQGSNSTNPADDARKAEASQQAQNAIQRLTKALDEQSVTQQAADSLRQGDYGGAAQKLGDVGQQNDQLSDAAKQDLSDSLQKAAQDSGSTPDLQQAEQQAADALGSGDYKSIADSLKNLSNALQKTAGDIIPQQELAKRFPDQSGQNQGSALQNGQQSQEQGQGQGQDGQQSQQGGQQGQNGQNGQNGQQSQQGQGNGQGKGQGQGNTQAGAKDGNTGSSSGGEGHNSRVTGPADNTKLNVGNNPFELDGKPRPGDTKPGDPNQQPGLTVEGNASSGSAMAPSQGGPSNAQSESNHPPVERWPIIQRYFGGDR